MHFDAYGLVYMGFNMLKNDKGLTDGDRNEHSAKVAVAAFNVNTKAMEFYWH